MIYERTAKRLLEFLESHVHLKTLLLGSALCFGGEILLGLLNYLMRRYLALSLGAEDYGFVYGALALLGLCLSITNFGTHKAGTILIAGYLNGGKRSQAEMAFGALAGFNFVVGAAIVCVLAPASFLLATRFFHYPAGATPFLLFMPYVVFSALAASATTGLSATKSFAASSATQCFLAFATFALCLLLLPRLGVMAVPLAFAGAALPGALLGFLLIRKVARLKFRPAAFFKSPSIRWRLLTLGGWVAVSNAGLSCMYSMDSILLTWLGGLKEVGLYNVALPIMQIAQGMIMVLPGVFVPIAAEMWSRGHARELRTQCRWMSLALLGLLPILLLAGLFCGKFVIRLLFSEEFVQASGAVTILWLGMVFYTIAQLHFNALNAGGRTKSVALLTACGALLNIALNVCLIPLWGIEGAASATGLTYAFIATASAWNLRKETLALEAKATEPSPSASRED